MVEKAFGYFSPDSAVAGNGFDTFREMKGSSEFLDTIAQRERALAAQLFAGADAPALSL